MITKRHLQFNVLVAKHNTLAKKMFWFALAVRARQQVGFSVLGIPECLTLLTVYASLATGYGRDTPRRAAAMPTGAIEPDEPQTGRGATSAVAGLKNLGAGLDHLAPIAWVAPPAALSVELTPPLLGLGCFAVWCCDG